MANWSDLKAAVASIVKTNGNKEITGQLLQNVLNNIISNVGLNSSFAGIATPETNPGTPDGNVFYLAATAGTYSNFNGIVINSGEAVILEWKGSWVKKDSGFATKEKLSELKENTNQKLSELEENTNQKLSEVGLKIENKGSADFSICDEKGNSIVDFVNGHIKTKNFSSDETQNGNSSNFPFGIKTSLYFYRSARLMRPNAQPLIVVIGQSNADGRADYTTAPAWLKDNSYQVPRYKVWDALNNDFKDYNVLGMTGNGGDVPGSDGSGTNKFAFDPFFAYQYLSDNPQKTLYMVRTTLGDTGLYDQPTTGSRNWTWNPDTDSIIDGCNSLLLALKDKVYKALTFAKEQNIELIPIAILWHQGERDASSEASIKAYKTNLSNLISWVRGLFDMPHLPFINAYINGGYSESYAKINAIFDEINLEDFYTKTVNMEGHYDMLTDNVHFNSQGLEYMGNKMYEIFKQLV